MNKSLLINNQIRKLTITVLKVKADLDLHCYLDSYPPTYITINKFYHWTAHSWNPPSLPIIKGGGRGVGLPNIESLGDLKRGAWCRNGRGLPLIVLLYSSIAFTMLCVGEGVKFPLLQFGSSVFWVNHARFSSKSL